jgi:hypothetical protein
MPYDTIILVPANDISNGKNRNYLLDISPVFSTDVERVPSSEGHLKLTYSVMFS